MSNDTDRISSGPVGISKADSSFIDFKDYICNYSVSKKQGLLNEVLNVLGSKQESDPRKKKNNNKKGF